MRTGRARREAAEVERAHRLGQFWTQRWRGDRAEAERAAERADLELLVGHLSGQ